MDAGKEVETPLAVCRPLRACAGGPVDEDGMVLRRRCLSQGI
jgi:hypothetical protein